MLKLMRAPAKYIQGKDALLSTYDETKNLGKSFLFICSRSGEKACRAHLEQSFAGKEAAIRFEIFGGHSSEGEIQRMRDIVRAHGIDCVAGVGGGKFAPEDQVTGFQAAKMLLVALGYEAERENFNTPMWETNVSVRAAQAGLFQGLDDLNPSAPLSRDSAAQMIWNALNAGEVEYVTQTVTEGNGQTATKVVLQDKTAGNTQAKLTLIKDKFGVDAPPAKP